jgi:L-fuconolactonase
MLEPAVPVIDCHQHFWRLAEHPHSFPPAVGDRLDRDFTEDDLRPSLAACGVDQTVLVQSLNDLAETEDYLDLAAEVDYVAGVVGWVPLADPAECAAALERLSGRDALVGIRHLIAYEPDPQWLLLPPVLESLALLAEAGLVFEGIPVDDAQLESLIAVTERLPGLKVALNHMGNPPVPEDGWEPWASQIARAAALPNMSVKLSAGLALVVRWQWSTEALSRYADHVLGLFGPDRVMAGSNWPVILLGASFEQAWHGIEDMISGLSETERAAILGGTAQRIFGI